MRVSAAPAALLGSAWAGLASAVICYAEYLGLGAVLGPSLLGYGDQNKSVATLLVVLSASVACLVLGLQRRQVLAGPRGASLSILVLALLWLHSHFSFTAAQQLGLLACLMLGCAAMQLLASHAAVQRLFDRLPSWLVPSFIYASAVGIAASAVGKYLYSCLQVAPAQTWAIFLSATMLGVLWPLGCKTLGQKWKDHAPRRAQLAQSLAGLALILAAGWAWLCYAFSSLNPSQGGRCARLGQVDLDVQVLAERWQSLLHSDGQALSLWALPCALIAGLAVGAVVVIEARTSVDTLRECIADDPLRDQAVPPTSTLLRTGGGLGLLLGAATSVVPSISQSRTQLLWSLGPRSHQAVLWHAIALLGIAAVASRWLAWLPQLSLAVLMTLVATQMVSRTAIDIWANAYNPQLAPAQGLRAGLGLWLVLGITALTGQVLLGFVLPALLYGALQLLRVRRVQRKKRGRNAAL